MEFVNNPVVDRFARSRGAEPRRTPRPSSVRKRERTAAVASPVCAKSSARTAAGTCELSVAVVARCVARSAVPAPAADNPADSAASTARSAFFVCFKNRVSQHTSFQVRSMRRSNRRRGRRIRRTQSRGNRRQRQQRRSFRSQYGRRVSHSLVCIFFCNDMIFFVVIWSSRCEKKKRGR